MIKRGIKKLRFKEFEKRCKEIATLIKGNSNIKNIFGVPRGGLIPATRVAYITGLPLTFSPNAKNTAIIDDCIDSGATRHSFGSFPYFYVLIDKQFEGITKWIEFWWEKDEKN